MFQHSASRLVLPALALAVAASCSLPEVHFDAQSDGGIGGSSGSGGLAGSGGEAGSAGNGGCGPAGAYRDAVLADGPIAWYRLGETSGNLAEDSSGSGLDLMIENGVSLGQPGALACDSDRAMRFANKAIGHLNHGKTAQLEPATSLSFEFWMQQSGTVTANEKPLWYGDAYLSPWGAWGFGRSQGNASEFTFHLNLAGISEAVVSAVFTAKDTWYYVAATYDGTTMKLYVDGKLEGQKSKPEIAGGPILYTDQGGFAVGGCAGTGCSTLTGMVDEVAIYDKVLAADRIAAHYAAARH